MTPGYTVADRDTGTLLVPVGVQVGTNWDTEGHRGTQQWPCNRINRVSVPAPAPRGALLRRCLPGCRGGGTCQCTRAAAFQLEMPNWIRNKVASERNRGAEEEEKEEEEEEEKDEVEERILS